MKGRGATLRVLDWICAGALCLWAGKCIGYGAWHMLYGPSPGPGVLLAALGGLLVWMAYRVARSPREDES